MTRRSRETIPPDLLLKLLQHTFDSQVELASSKTLNQSQDYLVLLLQLRRPDVQVVVKLAGPEAWMASSFERTAMLHHLVAMRTSVPLPEIIATNTSLQAWPWRYLVMAYNPGQEFARIRRGMSAEELSEMHRQIGAAVAQLHAIQFLAFGELADDGSVKGGGEFLPAFTERARRSIRSERLRDLFFSVLEERSQLFLDVRQPCLCHEDLHGYNILFQPQQDEWRLAAILDFDKAWAGHAEIDLARLQFWRGMTSQAFWEAYQAARPTEPGYELRRPIYQLLWCLEYAQPTRQHPRDTQRLCAKNGFPWLDEFE